MIYLNQYQDTSGRLSDSELSELHDCEQSKGKLVSISVDKKGISRCGYCGEVVNYLDWFKNNKKLQEVFKKCLNQK